MKPDENRGAHRAWTLPVLLILVSLPYLTALNHGFVYDDHGQLEENPFLRNRSNILKVVSLRTLADPHVINGRRPVVLATYWSDRMLWGPKPFGYHLTNLCLHLLTVLAAFIFIRTLARGHDPRCAPNLFGFCAALLFGVHPVLTEAVQAPSFRPDILFTLFSLLHLLCMLRAKRHPSWALFGLLALMLALGSKETAVMLPGVLWGLWICFPGVRLSRPAMARASVLAVVVILIFIGWSSRSGAFQAASGAWNGLSLRFPSNLLTSPWIWTRYLGLLCVPYPLVLDHVIPPVETLASVRFAVGALVLLTSVGLAVALRSKVPW